MKDTELLPSIDFVSFIHSLLLIPFGLSHVRFHGCSDDYILVWSDSLYRTLAIAVSQNQSQIRPLITNVWRYKSLQYNQNY